MKRILRKNIKFSAKSLLIIIDRIIDHKRFKPIAISIVISFILFNSIAVVRTNIADYREKSLQKKSSTPIKITITEGGKAINFNEIQVSEHRIKSGDTILGILTRMDVDSTDSFAILEALKKVFKPQDIVVGNSISIKYRIKINADPKEDAAKQSIVNELNIPVSSELSIIISRGKNGEYKAREVKQKLVSSVVRYSGSIKDGLYVDGVNAGISPTAMMNMIGLYAYDIDFQRDLHQGDKFEMLVESFFAENGRKIKDGNVLFSSITLKGKKIESYGHMMDGHLEYFDANGNSVKKSLLRTPVNGARISSGFGLRRHPILGYSRLHKGIDFAAPTGTPILAAGSGTITFMARHGGYGNFVRIKHNSGYETQYGHASKFAKKFRAGSKVKQGETIAYVGSTGRSTGPHLHFEVVHNGKAINPASVKSISGLRLGGGKLMLFKIDKEKIDNYRRKIPNEIMRSN